MKGIFHIHLGDSIVIMDSVQLLYIHQLYVLLILYRISWIQSSRSLVDIVDPMTPCQATRGLNLSEDIFAGLDLSLRGGWTVYREYFHVGKAQGIGEIVASQQPEGFQISNFRYGFHWRFTIADMSISLIQ